MSDTKVYAPQETSPPDPSLVCRLVYCPELKCGQALEKPDETEANYPLATCPACSKMMCVTCKVVWHAGTSCKQYQRLPMHLKNPEDVALLGLAGKEGWRQCPRCENLIERNADGCTYIKCRCGCPFCYTCGKVPPMPHT
ncbi:hypothetical protein T484DRAFT_1624230 [Baffinella frigidus]|nr:hypothetical protein T484DRAFT_1624230 [Cryptophyta sp. CCMP2293]